MTMCNVPLGDSGDVSNWRALYICSAARCGSTFTDMFIGGHSQAASLGEINLIGKAIALGQACSCGLSVPDCDHWNRVYDDLTSQTGVDIKVFPYAYRLWDALAWHVIDKKHQTRAYKTAVYLRKAWLEIRYRSGNRLPLLPKQVEALQKKLMLYGSVSRQWGKQIIIDSSKNPREVVELKKFSPQKIKVVLITRDGRGVFLSHRKSRATRRASLNEWMRYYQRALPLLQKGGSDNDLLILKYEDLASNPREKGTLLCDFLGLEFEEGMLDLGGAVRHMVNGNNTRFAPTKGIELDEKWRTELTGDDLDYFVRSGGQEMNRRLGYL